MKVIRRHRAIETSFLCAFGPPQEIRGGELLMRDVIPVARHLSLANWTFRWPPRRRLAELSAASLPETPIKSVQMPTSPVGTRFHVRPASAIRVTSLANGVVAPQM